MQIRLGIPRSRNEWIIALLGAATTIGCAVPMARGVQSLSWPKADGVITHSDYLPGRRTIGVDIAYRYTTGGREYNGNRFRFQFFLTATRMQGRDAQSTLGKYRVGEPVKVAVNPADAADSVLDPGPDFDTAFTLLIGLFLLLLGVGQVRKDEALEATPKLSGPARPRYLLATGLALAGGALCVLCAYNLYHGASSLEWPSVEGRIVYSHARTARPETLLWYEYTVDGRRYLASKYRNGGNATPFAGVAKEAAKRYSVGLAVPVYYNPRNPQEALLERGVWWGNFVAGILGVLLLGAAWLAKRYAEIMASRKTSGATR